MRDLSSILTNMRNRHFLVFDLIAMIAIPIMALALRLDAQFSWMYWNSLIVYTGLSILVKLPVFYKFGLYKHLWRYASIEEVSVILLAILTAAFIIDVGYLLVLPVIPIKLPLSIPRSVPAIDLMLSLSLHGGIRLLSRIFSTEMRKKDKGDGAMKRVLIIGAGNSGTMIAKEMLRNPQEGLLPVAFVDDDPRKKGGVIYSIPVLGGRDLIPEVVRKSRVEMILIAMPSASGRTIRAVMKIVDPLNIKTKTLPGVAELVSDTVDLRQFREVRIDDLLRREPVKTDMSRVRKMLHRQTVLVTGAGGSIGSELCRHIAQCQPKTIILLGHGENSIHSIMRELQETYPLVRLQCVIADIRDEDRIRATLEKHRPGFVYHTAAHKHVPLMEENVIEAVTNNVLGTIILLKCALDADIQNVTCISTDKAVQPRSVMGATKRMAEIALQIASRETNLHYVAVRFGNVLGSRGSVIPVFMDQIAKRTPITITHPEMRRYFMTIPEAVQLVLQASALEGNGEINVLDMGEPELILDLAIDLIQLAGLVPYKDIDIEFTGLRPGEKLTEELFRDGEIFVKSRHEKIFRVVDTISNDDNRDGSNGRHFHSLTDYETFVRNLIAIPNERSALLEYIANVVPDFDHRNDPELLRDLA